VSLTASLHEFRGEPGARCLMRLSAVDLRQVVKRGLPIAFVRREFTSYCCPKLCGAICRDSISAPA
jgi:hypothetical protein